MKQNQFLFVEIISALFLLIIFFGNFLGLLFISDGNTLISLAVSLILIVCYYFLVQQLTNKKEVTMNAKFPHFSHLLWIGFLLLGIITFFLTAHFVNIEYNAKQAIQSEVNYKLSLVESFPEQYEKRAKKDMQNYQVQIQSTSSQPIALARVAPMQIVVDQNLLKLKKNIDAENTKFKYVFENWKWFSLMSNYNKIDAYVDSNIVQVNQKLMLLPLDKSALSNIRFSKSILPLNNPLELNKQFHPNQTLPLAIVLISHLFILIPFFAKPIPKRAKGEEPQGAVIL